MPDRESPDPEWRPVELNGEILYEWTPHWTTEEEARIAAGVEELRQQNSILRKLREDLGMTQEEFAELLGVTQSNISKLEARPEPKLSILRRLIEHKGGRVSLLVELNGRTSVLPV